MNYEGAQEARKRMEVPCEIIRVPQVLYSPFLPIFVCVSTPSHARLPIFFGGAHLKVIDQDIDIISLIFKCRPGTLCL